MTTCADAQKLMIDVAADSPRDTAGEATLAEHVAGCPACAQLLAADRAARQLLADASWPAVPPSLDRKLAAVSAASPAGPTRLRRVSIGAAFVAAPVVLLMLAFASGRRWSVTSPAQPTASPAEGTAAPAATDVPTAAATVEGTTTIDAVIDRDSLLGHVESLAFAPNGRDVAFTTEWPNGGEAIYLAETGPEGEIGAVRELSKPPPGAVGVSFVLADPSGSGYAVGAVDEGSGMAREVWWLGLDGSWRGNLTAAIQGAATTSGEHYIEQAVWSPDGSALAVVDQDGRLWHVPVPAGTPRTLTEELRATYGGPGAGLAWSPDGARIAISEFSVPGSIDVLDVTSGDRTVVRTFPEEAPPVYWSEDGDSLYFSLQEAGGSQPAPDSSLFRIAPRAGAEPTVATTLGTARLQEMVSTLDYRFLLAAQEDGMTQDLRRIRLADGATDVIHLPGSLSTGSLISARDGRVALALDEGGDRRAVLTAFVLAPMAQPLVPTAASGLAVVTAVVHAPTAEPAWTPIPLPPLPSPPPVHWSPGPPSPDGQWQTRFGVSDRVAVPTSTANRASAFEFHAVVAVSAEGAMTRTLAAGWVESYDMGAPVPHILGWAPASDTVVIADRQIPGPCGSATWDQDIRQVDVRTGVTRPIVPRLVSAKLSPDGQTLAFEEEPSAADFAVGLLDVATGTRRVLSPPINGVMESDGGPRAFEWSDDSRLVAFLVMPYGCGSGEAVGVIDAVASSAWIVLPFGPPEVFRELRWDGATLVVEQDNASLDVPLPAGVPSELRIDPRTGVIDSGGP